MDSSTLHPSPLTRTSHSEDATSKIRRATLSGELVPSSSLPETNLAEQLGVRRVPVREARMELEQEGLIERDYRGWSRVQILSEKDFEERLSMRCTPEVMPECLLAKQIPPRGVQTLEAMLAALCSGSESKPENAMRVEMSTWRERLPA